MYIHRTIEDQILRTSGSFPAIVVYGPRQVGKSTAVMHLFADHYPSVTLDRAEDRQLALENPRLFLETYPWPVIIDEIKGLPGCWTRLRLLLMNRSRNG